MSLAHRTREAIQVPGDALPARKRMSEFASQTVQNFDPVNQFKLHMCGFAYYKDEPQRQVELHHYISWLTSDFAQATIFDGDGKEARLIGIEYIITDRVFNNLATEEQKYWHSHAHDIKTGSFIAPRLPDSLENPLARDLVRTYGKTWLLWQTDKGDTIPLGEPKLMMVAVKDGPVSWNPELFQLRDQRKFGYSTEHIREQRRDIQYPEYHPNGDWGILKKSA